MFFQKAIRATSLTHRRRANHHVVAGAKGARTLASAFDQRAAALGDLREVHALDVEARAALQIAHVIVHTFQAEDPERFELCHGLKIRPFTGRASAVPGSPRKALRSLSIRLSVRVRRGKAFQLGTRGFDAK